LGALFLLLQGREWAALIRFGLTPASGVYGGLFYIIVGIHAVHVAAALAALTWLWLRLTREPRGVRPENFLAARMLWYFVAGVWPFLYVMIYVV
jgi:heme/copper-type cytochrome/quinol oxidase subunit 3